MPSIICKNCDKTINFYGWPIRRDGYWFCDDSCRIQWQQLLADRNMADIIAALSSTTKDNDND